MSYEIDATIFGMRGKFKKVYRSQAKLKPCEHLISERDDLFKKSWVVFHGKENGEITCRKFKDVK